jgi:hypothetical protein
MMLGGKNCCTDKAVCIESATPGSAIVWMFSADFVLWMLENLTVIVLVNCLACRNKFLVDSAITVKQDV